AVPGACRGPPPWSVRIPSSGYGSHLACDRGYGTEIPLLGLVPVDRVLAVPATFADGRVHNSKGTPLAPRLAPWPRWPGSQISSELVRRAGFEPATRCLEGSRSIRLSYRRSVTIVQGKDHVLATRRSQCFAVRCH